MAGRRKISQGACKEFEQGLVLYYYGEAAGDERTRMERHLQGCAICREFLAGLGRLLPQTIKEDEPPQVFWQGYSREMRHKLASAEQRGRWWSNLALLLRPWPVPALATAMVLILALTLTFGKRVWRAPDLPPEEEGMMEILPMAENLEFFRAMDLLDSLELLEAGMGSGSGAA